MQEYTRVLERELVDLHGVEYLGKINVKVVGESVGKKGGGVMRTVVVMKVACEPCKIRTRFLTPVSTGCDNPVISEYVSLVST